MNLLGQAVKHKIYGAGVVTSVSGKILTICFEKVEKSFLYPDSFKSYLLLSDCKMQKLMEKQIEEQELQLQIIQKAEQAERARKYKMANFPIVANSHVVFNTTSEQIQQVMDSGFISTGTYLSGFSSGKPRIADRLKPNSLCLLTIRPHGKTEANRIVAGAFMAAEDYFGEDSPDGIVRIHENYRIIIPKESQVPFWQYFGSDVLPRWGNVTFKYFSVDAAVKLLEDITKHTESSDQKQKMIDFYKYFCRINRLHSFIMSGEDVYGEKQGL